MEKLVCVHFPPVDAARVAVDVVVAVVVFLAAAAQYLRP